MRRLNIQEKQEQKRNMSEAFYNMLGQQQSTSLIYCFYFIIFFNWDHLKHTLVQLSSLTYRGHLSKSSQIDLPHSLVISWICTNLSKHCPIYPIAYLLACRQSALVNIIIQYVFKQACFCRVYYKCEIRKSWIVDIYHVGSDCRISSTKRCSSLLSSKIKVPISYTFAITQHDQSF